jgi:peptide/nickel transport system ATP-binding protein
MIAMALACQPKLLLADEPTTALDVTIQAQILDLLKDVVAEEGMSLLLITHDLAVVADMAARIAVMKQGEIVESGPTARVLAERKHPYTRALFAASSHAPDRAALGAPEPLLAVENLRRTYPGPRQGFRRGPATEAVKGVSFQLHKGESLGLVGESGCGKSTLTRALLGLEPIQAGGITFQGAPGGTAMTNAQRARISVVFQDPYGSFDPRWTVARILAEPFHLTGRPPDAKARAARALEEVGLAASDLAKYPHEFSGGQRQRIAIARALITEPEVLVLDEAVSALDTRVRARVLALLDDLQRRLGLAYLFISHDLSVVRAICDRVLVMRAGRIVEDGPTDRVWRSPESDYTRTLIDAVPTIPADWTA